jgi:hypothetical protein
MIGGMDNGKSIPPGLIFLSVLIGAPLLVPLLVIMAEVPTFGVTVAAGAGALAIFGLVRWINRRITPPSDF